MDITRDEFTEINFTKNYIKKENKIKKFIESHKFFSTCILAFSICTIINSILVYCFYEMLNSI